MYILGFDKCIVDGAIYFLDDFTWRCLLILDAMKPQSLSAWNIKTPHFCF